MADKAKYGPEAVLGYDPAEQENRVAVRGEIRSPHIVRAVESGKRLAPPTDEQVAAQADGSATDGGQPADAEAQAKAQAEAQAAADAEAARAQAEADAGAAKTRNK